MSARVKGVRVASAPPWPQEMPGLGVSENQESGMSGQGLGAWCGHRLAVNTLQNPDNWCSLYTMFFSALCIMLDIAWGGPAKPRQKTSPAQDHTLILRFGLYISTYLHYTSTLHVPNETRMVL